MALAITPPDYNAIVAAECKLPYLDPNLGQYHPNLEFAQQNYTINIATFVAPVAPPVALPVDEPNNDTVTQNSNSNVDHLNLMLSDLQSLRK